MSSEWSSLWDPSVITLADESIPDSWKVCVLQGAIDSDEDSDGSIAGRIVAIFVILITSLLATLFPVIARRIKKLRIPEMVYTAVKNFGTGVIITTAFIHLMDPAYGSIGANSCVGGIGHWSDYAWCPALILASAMGTFLVDTYCGFFSERWYGTQHSHNHDEVADVITNIHDHQQPHGNALEHNTHVHDHNPAGQVHTHAGHAHSSDEEVVVTDKVDYSASENSDATILADREFHSQFSGFMIVELGVILHSVFIGLALGSTNDWVTLFIVIIFHQMFEGLGIGVRMSMIPFPKSKRWWPYYLSLAYSLTTPIAIGIGIGVRGSYSEDGLKQMRVQGICDALSCGVLIYTGFVELLARDWIFNPCKTKSLTRLNVQLFFLLLGAGLMALLGKWA